MEAIDYKKRCFYASVYRHNRTNYVKSADVGLLFNSLENI